MSSHGPSHQRRGDCDEAAQTARPPVPGQERLDAAPEWEHRSDDKYPYQKRSPDDTSISPTPSTERPTQLCGQSMTPTSDCPTLATPDSDRLNRDITPDSDTDAKRPINKASMADAVLDRNSSPLLLSSEYENVSSLSRVTYQPVQDYETSTQTSRYQSSSAAYGSGDSQLPLSMFGDISESDPHANTPPWLRWALALHYLLHDANGVNLFRKYLMMEGKQHVDALEFWFAVEGLHGQITPETVAQLVKVIYRRYFMKTQLPLEDMMRKEVTRKYKLAAPHMLADLFDAAQNHVENLMRRTTYPNFLKSDIYLQYVQSMQNSEASIGSSNPSQDRKNDPNIGYREIPPPPGGNGFSLPTVHEDSELITEDRISYLGGLPVCEERRSPLMQPPRLTKDLLLATQKCRALEVRPKSETFAGVPPLPLSAYHVAYAGYNPVSRVDSELQSLSSHSDARTESDSVSISDISSIDGSSLHHQRARRMHARQARELASINRESASASHVLIPRTQRPPRDHQKPLPPAEFAACLTQKLEALARDRDVQETLNKKLQELCVASDSASSITGACSIGDSVSMAPISEVPSRILAAALGEKLNLDDDNDQDILDQHVSRVFSDLTPSRSPGGVTPQSRVRGGRKERDVQSTFSSDSGNVMDFPDSSSASGMVKSRSVGDYHDSDRFIRTSIGRRSSSKKTLTDLTDSGVSVLSDVPPIIKDIRRGGRVSTRKEEPAQPFIADPSMPPLPSPHTPTQLEEARRRLMEAEIGTRSRYREPTASGQSTLRRTTQTGLYTTVVFSFCDEQFPYRIRIPGASVTLKQFKDNLPKKGSYRYFFKTTSYELDNQVINEEISCDADILPLWEGKVMAQVKPID